MRRKMIALCDPDSNYLTHLQENLEQKENFPLMKKKTDILNPENLSDLNCYASIWCSIENVWLSATSEGYGCNVRIPWGDEEKIARNVLGFPEDYLIPCFIGIGRPAEGAVKTKQLDVDLDKMIHWQMF